jgi:hypothetical protein
MSTWRGLYRFKDSTLCKPCTKYNEKNERLDWLKLYKSMYKNNLITKVATVGEM